MKSTKGGGGIGGLKKTIIKAKPVVTPKVPSPVVEADAEPAAKESEEEEEHVAAEPAAPKLAMKKFKPVKMRVIKA